MTEDEAKALASEFEHHKIWRVRDVQRHDYTYQQLPSQWGIYLERRDNPHVVILLDIAHHEIIQRSLAWGEAHEVSPHYFAMNDGTALIVDVWNDISALPLDK